MNKWDLMLQEELRKQPVDLYQFVQRCCVGFPVTSQQVINHLLSVEDEEDIIHSGMTVEMLRLHIKLWFKSGMPHYSGKQFG